MLRKVTLIEGDGIGPEIAQAVVRIFEAATVPIQWEYATAGLRSVETTGQGVAPATLDAIQRNGIALKGPTTTPVGGGHTSVNVEIRKKLELYANVRLAKSMPSIDTRFSGVDILIFRENVEDTYAGIEHWQTQNVAQCLKLITRQGSEALIRYAFDQAQTLGRKRVTCVHKANIHKITDGLFLDVFREVARDFPELTSDDIIVDNCCMQLVTRPEQFDVLVLPNLYGDIVSDLCAGLVGGLGVAPGGNIGHDCAVFEAVHGSAPDIAGKNMANPTAILLSSIQMLQFMGLVAHANAIMAALTGTLASGTKTRDLGGTTTTSEFTDAIIARLESVAPDVTGIMAGASSQVRRRPTNNNELWELRGVDVFIAHDKGIPQVPESFEKFTLRMISNRGTQVWPRASPRILLVDHYRARYVADSQVTREEIMRLVSAIADAGFAWCHLELLHYADGEPRYTITPGA